MFFKFFRGLKRKANVLSECDMNQSPLNEPNLNNTCTNKKRTTSSTITALSNATAENWENIRYVCTYLPKHILA